MRNRILSDNSKFPKVEMRFGKREALESLGDFENAFLFSVWLLSNVRLARLAHHDPDRKKARAM